MSDRRSFISKEDLTSKISKSVFVTNFPEHFTARDLWNVFTAYGKVVDVYIPLKKSKAGKKFAFVRFLKVDNLERLIENLCTIWIGHFCLHANPIRFHREVRVPFPRPTKVNVGTVKNSFVSVLKSNSHKVSSPSGSTLAIVMDDSCIVDKDLSCSLMWKIKDINALSNIYVILADEGFDNNSSSDEESVKDEEINSFKVDNIDHVSESSCMKENNEPEIPNSVSKKGTQSKDPFRIYTILNRNNQNEKSKGDDPTFPPGFTPKAVDEKVDEDVNGSVNNSNPNLHSNKDGVSSVKCGSNRSFKLKTGGSILEVMEDLIEIGHAMSPSVGFSGGILCVWDPNMFSKYNVTLSDSFVAVHECVILGDFNEVRSESERFGTIFNDTSAKAFNHFISSASLIDLPLEGYSYTWALKSASKMSKLDRFLISEGLLSIYPSLSAICLDKHGFDKLIEDTWNNAATMDSNKISLLRKKFQALKTMLDNGMSNDDIINERTSLLKDLQEFNKRHTLDMAQKAKIRWAIEGDENSKYFHGIINKKRSQLAIRGVLVDGEWIEDPFKVKNEFLHHFSNRFSMPTGPNISLLPHMFNQISLDQNAELESDVTYEEIKKAVWDCGTNKSPGPDGFTFEFFRKYWKHSADLCMHHFFLFALSITWVSRLVHPALEANFRKSSLPIYQMSIYKTPVGVLRNMESIRRRFFNGGDINENKMSMIGWEKIMASRKKGGLGILSFFAQNCALMFKWIWRFKSQESSLWYRVIKAMFGEGGSFDIPVLSLVLLHRLT
ncbi:RNA-directed DNA polymerase, eukaryota [Tanacetum coccineum]